MARPAVPAWTSSISSGSRRRLMRFWRAFVDLQVSYNGRILPFCQSQMCESWATGVNDNSIPSDTTDDIDVLWWGAEVEHAVTSFGDDGFVSLFARYDGYYYREDDSGGVDQKAFAHVFKLGVRMDMNQVNPMARERQGVAVDLPNMNRINGHSRTVE